MYSTCRGSPFDTSGSINPTIALCFCSRRRSYEEYGISINVFHKWVATPKIPYKPQFRSSTIIGFQARRSASDISYWVRIAKEKTEVPDASKAVSWWPCILRGRWCSLSRRNETLMTFQIQHLGTTKTFLDRRG